MNGFSRSAYVQRNAIRFRQGHSFFHRSKGGHRGRAIIVISPKVIMKQCLLKLSVAGLAIYALCCPIHVDAATVTWVGGSGDWNTTNNWSTGASLAPVESNRARMWFYRPNHRNGWNETLQIRVDGAYVGTAENGGFFSVDVEPGSHQVSQALLPKIETITVDAPAGNEVFIMTLVSHGFSFTFPKPELVPNTPALNEIEHLELRGN